MRGPSENLQCKNGETSSAFGDPLDLCDQPLLLYMNFLGTPQLCGGLYVFFFYKVSFLKHTEYWWYVVVTNE